MRPNSALLVLSLAAVAVLFVLLQPSEGRGQDKTEGKVLASSLQMGPAFHQQSQLRYENQLSFDERAALVRLKSRYALSSSDCPLPTSEPRQPFYLTLRGDMSAGLRLSLQEAGAGFVGYVYRHTYILRAIDNASLQQIGQLIRGHDEVLGTLLRHPMDASSQRMWEMLESGQEFAAEFRILFFRDIDGVRAEQVLKAAKAQEVRYTRYADGTLDLETPYLDASLKRDGVLRLVGAPEVEWVYPKPVWVVRNSNSTSLSNASPTDIGPSTSYNLDGTGMTAAIWDGGRVQLHADFGSRVTVASSAGTSGHATHVMGTVLGSGAGNASARGFAPAALGYNYDFGGNVPAERRLLRHNVQHVADNHSYGSGFGPYGGYNGTAQVDDVDDRDLLMIQCRSAGNDGPATTSITDDAGSKNTFIVGSTFDSGAINDFSSRGPMNDGRLLPHICANGNQLTSTYPTNTYAAMSGTSMSSPSLTGAMTLLAQLWMREHNDMHFAPDMAKAIACQTAMDVGNTGPDYLYGFGVMDVKGSADLILADKASGGKRLVRGIARPSSVSDYDVNITSSGTPFKVTLSWLDIAASSSTGTILVNDLDLELYDPANPTSNPHYPYSGLTSGGSQNTVFTQTTANRRDNTVQCVINSPMVGLWKIRVIGFSLPDATTPIGFVIASSHDIERSAALYEDSLNSSGPVTIPDNNPTGLVRTFNVTQSAQIMHLRVYATVIHSRRGHIDIKLKAPNNTEVFIETGDTSNRDDIFGIYPDTRKYDDDVDGFYNMAANGIWTVTVVDITNGTTGTLDWLAIEFEFFPGVPGNIPPVADAGPNQTVDEGDPVSLDGTNSFDADSDPLTYVWSQTGGSPSVTLTGATTSTPSFTAPQVVNNQVLTFTLTVNDGRGGFNSDSVDITITDLNPPNNPPTADAGPNQTVDEGDPVTLDGTASSDPDSDPLTFAWVQIGGTPSVTLTGATTSMPTFTAPQVGATTNLTFRLTVDDGRAGTDTDTVVITVTDVPGPNNPPTADAGTDFSVTEAVTAFLNGTGSSDPDADPLTYAWVQTAGSPTVTLTGATSATPSFTAPMVTAQIVLTFQLTVDDGRGGSDTDSVNVTILDSATNNPPTADAGAEFAVAFGLVGTLDGSGSFDPDSDPLTYTWLQVGGAAVTLSSATVVQPTFTAGSVDDTLIFQLTVDDGQGANDVAIVIVYINSTGTVPGPPPPVGGGGGGSKDGGGGCVSTGQTGLLWGALLLPLLALYRRRRKARA